MNTLGAVTGAVIATFFSLEAIGNRMTLWSACAVNLLVAVIASVLARNGTASVVVEEESPAAKTSPPRFVLAASAIVRHGRMSGWSNTVSASSPIIRISG